MKTTSVLGSAGGLAAMTLAMSLALAGPPPDPKTRTPNATVENFKLTKAAPRIDKTSEFDPAEAFVVVFVVDDKSIAGAPSKNKKDQPKTFQIGGMDADESASPVSQLPQEQCLRLQVYVDVYRKPPGLGPLDKIHSKGAHGEWSAGKCILKAMGFGQEVEAWNWTPPMPVPAAGTKDEYRVVVTSGFTVSPWPKSAAGFEKPVPRFRKAKASIQMVQ